jgi:aldehyde dehydrogenase (NAD+)
MGGKNAVTIMADADLDAAIDAVVSGAFRMAGQKCTATSRLLVERPILDEVAQRLQDAVAELVVSDPRIAGAFSGPVVDAASQARLGTLIEQAHAVVPGCRGREHRPDGGYYVEPALVLEPSPSDPIVRDELFGPVLTVESFATLDEAVDLANQSSFGLVSAIWTGALRNAMKYSAAVRCGTVLVNQPTSGLDFNIPFGGWKGSGAGGSEQGDESLAVFGRTKVNYVSW